MTESDWAMCNDARPMLRWLIKMQLASRRKQRLFACACVRRLWPLLHDERSRRAIEVQEQHPTGPVTEAEAWAAGTAASRARYDVWNSCRVANDVDNHSPEMAPAWAAQAVLEAVSGSIHACIETAAVSVACSNVGQWQAGHAAECANQAALLRDLLGPLPFRPVALDLAWLTWNDGVVRCVAQAIYEERAFDRLPVLADCLEEAGCTEREILGHLRGPDPHALGCWALDLVLAKT